MDFVRYDAAIFYQYKSFDVQNSKYEHFVKTMSSLKKQHDCFQVIKPKFIDKTIHPKVKIQRPVHINKTEQPFHLFVRSCLNKLTTTTFEKIYNSIHLKITNENLEETIKQILIMSNESNLFTELYVGLIINLYASVSKPVLFQNVINNFFQDIFENDYYVISNETVKETYDEFCDRIKMKKNILHKIKTYLYLLQDTNINKYIERNTNELFDVIFEVFEKCYRDDDEHIYTLEQVIDCLNQCLIYDKNIRIPIISKSKINDYMKLNQLIYLFPNIKNEYIITIENYQQSFCSSKKLKFKCIDLIEQIKLI